MRKFLFTVLLIGIFVTVYFYVTTPRSTPIYLSPTPKISIVSADEANYKLIKKINSKNQKIKSLIFDDISIKFKHKAIAIRVTGDLKMKKEKYFRLNVSSIFGKELDLGSNDKVFWFWSKRIKGQNLYYAKHADSNKTLLKVALNPSWLMESLNVGNLPTENINFLKMDGYLCFQEKRISNLGTNVKIITLIDKKKELVVGRYLFNEKSEMIASTEVIDFWGNIPKNIVVKWPEEKIIMEWIIGEPKINVEIDNSAWEMPSYLNRVDISKTIRF
jgi:hypothetical protein